ncbi:MAG: hypothetical protein HYX63_23535 [Gammaproteobacteria bacterium]|nr:hypothetical protein [Gammaproteobacteria bacterium]
MNTRLAIATLTLLIANVSTAMATTLTFPNTGNGSLVGGTIDPNWTYTNSQGTGLAQVLSPDKPNWFGDWVLNDATSSWIGVSATDISSHGFPLVFTSKFDLSGINIATWNITGSWTIDDGGVLLVNGNFIDFQGAGNWGSLHNFSVPTADLVPGVNTVSIVFTHDDNFLEGVRFNLAGTQTVVPVPAALPLLGSALGVFGFLRRRLS